MRFYLKLIKVIFIKAENNLQFNKLNNKIIRIESLMEDLKYIRLILRSKIAFLLRIKRWI